MIVLDVPSVIECTVGSGLVPCGPGMTGAFVVATVPAFTAPVRFAGKSFAAECGRRRAGAFAFLVVRFFIVALRWVVGCHWASPSSKGTLAGGD